MKVDAETLMKNRFWLLAGLVPLVALIAFIVLATAVAGQINNKKKDIEKKLGAIKNYKDAKRPNEVDHKGKEAAVHKALEDVVWKNAWDEQAPLSTWPKEFESTFHFKDGLFATEIKAERSKEPATEAGGAEGGPAPAKGPTGEWRGTILKITKEWMSVAGMEGKDKKEKTFYRTAQVKVTLNGEPSFFDKLKAKDRVTLNWQQGKWFGDELTSSEKKLFIESYKTQLPEILLSVNPVRDDGKGVVQLKGWTYNEEELVEEGKPAGMGFFNFVPKWTNNRYLSKEAWTAQEDLWIQRELYRLINRANQSVAKFHGQGGEGAGKEFTFNNPYWELTLSLTADKQLAVKRMKNLLPRRQKADLTFLVQVRPGAEPTPVVFGGMEPFDPFQIRENLTYRLQEDADPVGIYGVEQALGLMTAAVKRIDLIKIGSGNQAAVVATSGKSPLGSTMSGGGSAQGAVAQSHRTFIKPLVKFSFPGEPLDKDKDAEKDESKETRGMPDMKKGGSGFPGVAGKGGGGRETTASPNGFVFERYLDPITTQARRVPVGLVLIVDQQHVGLVHAAFADSNLRFLTTQVLLNRYPHNLRAPEATMVASTGFTPGAANPVLPKAGGSAAFYGVGSGYGMRGGPMPKGPGAFEPQPSQPPLKGGPVGRGTGTAGVVEEQEANVELVLYGIVTLYERYPTNPQRGQPPSAN
jgi:hypothetical protein